MIKKKMSVPQIKDIINEHLRSNDFGDVEAKPHWHSEDSEDANWDIEHWSGELERVREARAFLLNKVRQMRLEIEALK